MIISRFNKIIYYNPKWFADLLISIHTKCGFGIFKISIIANYQVKKDKKNMLNGYYRPTPIHVVWYGVAQGLFLIAKYSLLMTILNHIQNRYHTSTFKVSTIKRFINQQGQLGAIGSNVQMNSRWKETLG
jgi:hypothetical protein